MIDELYTALAPILDDQIIKTKGIGIFRKNPDGTTIIVKEKPVADYESIGISQPRTAYLRWEGDLTQVSAKKITCEATLVRARATIHYVMAFTNETKNSMLNYMMYKIGQVTDSTWTRSMTNKQVIMEEEQIQPNTYEFSKVVFNVEFNYVTNGECPVEFTCVPC